VGAYAQHRLLLKLDFVGVDYFANGLLTGRIVGMKELEHLGILINDFTVCAAPLTRGSR
jgi:hypothetical protein